LFGFVHLPLKRYSAKRRNRWFSTCAEKQFIRLSTARPAHSHANRLDQARAYLRAGFGVLLGTMFLGENINVAVGVGLGAAMLGAS